MSALHRLFNGQSHVINADRFGWLADQSFQIPHSAGGSHHGELAVTHINEFNLVSWLQTKGNPYLLRKSELPF